MAGSIIAKTISQEVVTGTTQPLYIGGKLADGSDAKLTVATDGSISTATPLTVPSLTVNSQPVMSSLLASYTVTGSAVTSIDFSGLDINTHKSYRIEVNLIKAGASSTGINCYINNDITTTNYYSQTFYSDSTTVGASRVNAPLLLETSTGVDVFAIINVGLSNGYFRANSSLGIRNGSAIMNTSYYATKTATVTNITQLTFTASVANAIGVGSTIRIYRGDV